MERTFSLDTRMGIWASITYQDTEMRAALKARGYQWKGVRRAWLLARKPREMAAEAEALGRLGFRMNGSEGINRAAQMAAKFALSLPLPVRVYWDGHDDWQIGGLYEVEPVGTPAPGWNDGMITVLTDDYRSSFCLWEQGR
jgi:hypothetical protein